MKNTRFADIILPLAVRGRFTYRIPENMLDSIKPGIRVTVQFGNRNLYSGIVCKIHDNPPDFENVKSILNIQDAIPVINEQQLKLWLWISEYYLCSEGEVMKAALPSEISLIDYKPRLETFIELSKRYDENELNEILDRLKKAPKQQDLLSSYIRLSGYASGSEIIPVSRTLLLSDSHSSPGIIDALTGKGILKQVSLPVSRIAETGSFKEPVRKLSEAQ